MGQSRDHVLPPLRTPGEGPGDRGGEVCMISRFSYRMFDQVFNRPSFQQGFCPPKYNVQAYRIGKLQQKKKRNNTHRGKGERIYV